MHASSNLTHGNPAHGIPRMGASLVLLLLGCWGIVTVVRSMPDIWRQLARPCPACGLDVFAPPLEPYGFAFRDAGAVGKTLPPMTVATATRHSQPGGSLRWLGPNGTIALDRASPVGVGPQYAWNGARFAPDSTGIERMDDGPPVRNSWSGMPIWSLPTIVRGSHFARVGNNPNRRDHDIRGPRVSVIAHGARP